MAKFVLRLSDRPGRRRLLLLGAAVAALVVLGAGWGAFEALQPPTADAGCRGC